MKVVSERLGHSSAKMTLDVYAHVIEHQQTRLSLYWKNILKNNAVAPYGAKQLLWCKIQSFFRLCRKWNEYTKKYAIIRRIQDSIMNMLVCMFAVGDKRYTENGKDYFISRNIG